MTKMKAKTYPAEFKESAVKLAIESKRPVAQTAKELGITRTTPYTLVDKYSKPKESTMRTDEHLYDDFSS
jgi:transposase